MPITTPRKECEKNILELSFQTATLLDTTAIRRIEKNKKLLLCEDQRKYQGKTCDDRLIADFSASLPDDEFSLSMTDYNNTVRKLVHNCSPIIRSSTRGVITQNQDCRDSVEKLTKQLTSEIKDTDEKLRTESFNDRSYVIKPEAIQTVINIPISHLRPYLQDVSNQCSPPKSSSNPSSSSSMSSLTCLGMLSVTDPLLLIIFSVILAFGIAYLYKCRNRNKPSSTSSLKNNLTDLFAEAGRLNIDVEKDKVLENYCCGISFCVARIPVQIYIDNEPCEQTIYDQSEIKEWLDTKKETPINRVKCKQGQEFTLIKDWRTENAIRDRLKVLIKAKKDKLEEKNHDTDDKDNKPEPTNVLRHRRSLSY